MSAARLQSMPAQALEENVKYTDGPEEQIAQSVADVPAAPASKIAAPRFRSLEDRLKALVLLHPYATVLAKLRETGELLVAGSPDYYDDAEVALRCYIQHFLPRHSGCITINERKLRISWLVSELVIVVFVYPYTKSNSGKTRHLSTARLMESCAALVAKQAMLAELNALPQTAKPEPRQTAKKTKPPTDAQNSARAGTCRRYTAEFKLAAVQLVMSSDVASAQIAKRLGVPKNTLQNWLRAHTPAGVDVTISRLESKLQRLKVQQARAKGR